MSRSHVVVTGGTGFLGSEVVKKLVDSQQFTITALDINPPSLGTKSFPSVDYVRANILDRDELTKIFQKFKPMVVIHTAGVVPEGHARYSIEGKEEVFEINVRGTKNVVETSKECGVKGLVFTSSVTVLMDEVNRGFANADETWPVGRATLVYGQSKTAAEALVLAANTPDFATCALRAAPIFGINDSIIPQLYSLIPTSSFILGSGENLIDFVYLSNVADAHALAVQNLLSTNPTAAGEAIFITNGEPLSARDFCIAVWKEFGHVPKWTVRISKDLGWWLGLAAEYVGWITRTEIGFSRGLVSDGTAERYVTIAKARRLLGYEPKISLPDAIQISCECYKEKLASRSKTGGEKTW